MTAYLLWGGSVWGHPGCDAILLADGYVARIGSIDQFADTDAVRVDGRGGSILPGFTDAHTHLVESGLAACGFVVDVSGQDREETLADISAAARSRGGGEWLMVTGWDESRWDPPSGLRRADLDRTAPGAAVVAVRVDGHVAVLNSAALGRAAGDLAEESRLVDPETGEVREAAVDRVRQLVCPDETTLRDALRAAAKICHRLGITTAHVLSGQTAPDSLVAAAPRVRLRLVVHPPDDMLEALAERGIRSGDGDDWARWGGVKLFADGSVGARNAAFSLPYVSGGRGELNHPLDHLRRRIAAADRRGWQTLIHAIGNRAIDQVLRAHRRASSDPGLRHRVEHYEFPAEDHIEQTRALGLAVCMQPNFVGNWSGPGRLYETALGPARDADCNPLRAVLDAGVPLGFGSDGMPLGPLYGIASAVSAPHAGQRIAVDEAVRAYTSGSARLAVSAPSPGSLAVGAVADIAVLDGPLVADGLETRQVAQTWVGGERTSHGLEDG